MFTEDQKKQYRSEKKNKIIALRKMLSQMPEDQRQAVAEKFGIVTVEGHQLTPYNQCFLISQSNINFSIVGGFQQWRKAGRTVKKGEHGFLILVPSKNRESSEKSPLDVPMGKEEDQNIDNFILDDEDIRFYSATVFDISQTEPLENVVNKLKTE